MGLYIKDYLLLALFNISTILGQNLCPSSHCGNVTVHYPFKFEDEAMPSSSFNCSYFNLRCDRTTIVSLPPAGDFYVQKIDYAEQYIQLYDPQNCLTERLFDLSLPISPPFKADYDNYTLYVCPLDLAMDPIPCLTNSTNMTLAARGSYMDIHGCVVTRRGLLPIDHDNTFLFLNWDYGDCIKCKNSSDHDSGRWGSKAIAKIVTVALTLPGLIIMSLSCCTVFCFHLARMIGGRVYGAGSGEAEAAAATDDAGLEESKIVGCTELVIVSEGKDGGGESCKSKTCSICLENYSEKETVSAISKCGHCFHADCIHQWLGKNATCPVCRTSLSDDAV